MRRMGIDGKPIAAGRRLDQASYSGNLSEAAA